MFDIYKWLNEEHDGVPRHTQISRLVFANGGFDVYGWGIISTGADGITRGLDQSEALLLMRIGSFLNGLEACGVDWSGAFKPHYDAYVNNLLAGLKDQP